MADRRLEALCNDDRVQLQELNKEGSKKLKARLSDLRGARSVADLTAGNPHPLTRDLAGHYAVRLDGGRRLVFRPTNQPPPTRSDGSVDWEQVTAVCIVEIGDYHA